MLVTGGCSGADFLFEKYATEAHDAVLIQSFVGHSLVSYPARIARVNIDHAPENQALLAKIAKRLKRPTSTNAYTKNLLLRNISIANSIQILYAISTIQDKRKGIISGGTAWAIEAFIDRCPIGLIALFLFDMEDGVWKACRKLNNDCEREWITVEKILLPTREIAYGGIGTRDTNRREELVIESLFRAMNSVPR